MVFWAVSKPIQASVETTSLSIEPGIPITEIPLDAKACAPL